MSAARFTYSAMIISTALILAAAILWLSNLEIDLKVERYFYQPETGFIFNNNWLISALRKLAIYSYAAWYVAIIASVFISRTNNNWPLSKALGLGFKQWVFLAITALAGPLLIANIILKNNWGRARPRQLVEFGGSLDFTPPLILSDQCQTNCSFVSGEPSSMFMIFMSLAFIIPTRRGALIALAIVMGTLSGIMRMGQGGHFLSDVVFAGLFMTLTAAIIYWAMFLSKRSDQNASVR